MYLIEAMRQLYCGLVPNVPPDFNDPIGIAPVRRYSSPAWKNIWAEIVFREIQDSKFRRKAILTLYVPGFFHSTAVMNGDLKLLVISAAEWTKSDKDTHPRTDDMNVAWPTPINFVHPRLYDGWYKKCESTSDMARTLALQH